ncbi:MAG: FMN-binding negative transcriptional regulator [Rhodocyclaceae bacterium]|nr:MAG: FMN-binding negative transcriptional regulator [Rhodocyclaceae bacterium]
MYLPAHFQETRGEVLAALMRTHPFATLVTTTADAACGFSANHLPLEYDPLPAPFGTLRGHVARANPLWREAAGAAGANQALAIFQGPHAYISPAWYPSKLEAGKAVPTWNYAVVHAHGRLKFFEDRQQLRDLVAMLTDRHEAGRPHPWRVSDAPEDYLEQMLKAIVGFEMPVTRLVGKWKVSQNRATADRAGVIAGLNSERGIHATDMANLIKETLQ